LKFLVNPSMLLRLNEFIKLNFLKNILIIIKFNLELKL